VYEAYARIFDVHTHGWMNVHAAHLNLPMGRSAEAVAMHNASALVIPYLPALAASSPMYDGVLQDAADGRMEWIMAHQRSIPETQGEVLPEYVSSLADYRRRILQPMYEAIDTRPGAYVLRHDFLNARGAVLKMARRALEIRVVDMQECVKMDIAIAVFVRSLLRHYSQRILKAGMELPGREALLGDFRTTVRCGSRGRVLAPHLTESVPRDADGTTSTKDALKALLALAERSVRRDEADYLTLIAKVIESGTLSERIRARLALYAGDRAELHTETVRVYGELADCLIQNRPWSGRWMETG
jgi:carboxylate-amine ligase